MKAFFGHLHTVNKHRFKVLINCTRAGIFSQGLRHDLSKYSPTEFIAGVKYYQNGKRSPNECEREIYGYSKAWMHHKGRNKHHFEYWTDYDPVTKHIIPVKMPTKYVIEMFCDRIAASKVYLKDKYTDRSALDYFLNSKHRRSIHPETSDLLESLLTMLSEKGEKETFKYIRSIRKDEKSEKKVH
ncbi:MAG: DUF5662 family protein [Acutalibacteraceae bacterium]